MNKTLQLSKLPAFVLRILSIASEKYRAGTKWETGELRFAIGFLVDTVVACPNTFFFLIWPITKQRMDWLLFKLSD